MLSSYTCAPDPSLGSWARPCSQRGSGGTQLTEADRELGLGLLGPVVPETATYVESPSHHMEPPEKSRGDERRGCRGVEKPPC